MLSATELLNSALPAVNDCTKDKSQSTSLSTSAAVPKHVCHWQSFIRDLKTFRQTCKLPGGLFPNTDISSFTNAFSNEEGLRAILSSNVLKCLQKLITRDNLAIQNASSTLSQNQGLPDFLVVHSDTKDKHSVIEVKVRNLDHRISGRPMHVAYQTEDKVKDTVYQITGYLYECTVQYGAVTTYTNTYFCKLDLATGVLYISDPVSFSTRMYASTMSALYYMVHLAGLDANHFSRKPPQKIKLDPPQQYKYEMKRKRKSMSSRHSSQTSQTSQNNFSESMSQSHKRVLSWIPNFIVHVNNESGTRIWHSQIESRGGLLNVYVKIYKKKWNFFSELEAYRRLSAIQLPRKIVIPQIYDAGDFDLAGKRRFHASHYIIMSILKFPHPQPELTIQHLDTLEVFGRLLIRHGLAHLDLASQNWKTGQNGVMYFFDFEHFCFQDQTPQNYTQCVNEMMAAIQEVEVIS